MKPLTKKRPLDTIELNRMMRDDKHFKGTKALNLLTSFKPLFLYEPLKLIVNLQTDSYPGNHWIAILRKRSGVATYFDSLGKYPPTEIANWLHKNSTAWNYTKTKLQKLNDLSSCGYLCVNFLKKNNV